MAKKNKREKPPQRIAGIISLELRDLVRLLNKLIRQLLKWIAAPGVRSDIDFQIKKAKKDLRMRYGKPRGIITKVVINTIINLDIGRMAVVSRLYLTVDTAQAFLGWAEDWALSWLIAAFEMIRHLLGLLLKPLGFGEGVSKAQEDDQKD